MVNSIYSKVKIGKLRNRRTGKHYKKGDVRSGYQWSDVKSFRKKSAKYKLYFFDKKGVRPVPRNNDNGLMKPPIWEGEINESHISFYRERSDGSIVKDVGRTAVQLHDEWGEGIYQVQVYPGTVYPGKKIKRIQNLFKPALVQKVYD